MKIYVADDEPHICLMIQRQFEHQGHLVKTFSNGLTLLEAFRMEAADIVITDIMMPTMDGYDLCREIRSLSDIPIIILSAKGSEDDRIKGLELGVDDYLPKPFSLKELELKVIRMMKRYKKTDDYGQDELEWHNLSLHVVSHQVRINEEAVQISEKEYQFLKLLIENMGKAFSREEITTSIWGYDYIEDTRMLDHLVKRLRKKLAEQGCKGQIETIWGFGFKVKKNED